MIIAIGALLLAAPRVAFADAGVPMIFLVMPAMAMSILPIIAVEAFYLHRSLPLPVGVAAKTATTANLVSTLVSGSRSPGSCSCSCSC
jgi:hypothetical protein